MSNIKINILLLSIVILLIGYSTAKSDDSIHVDNMEFNFSSQPNSSGSKTEGLVRYYYTCSISSSIYGVYETRTTYSAFGDREDSLIVADTKDFTMDFFFAEYSIPIIKDHLKLRGGAAFSLTNSVLKEKGYFITSPENPMHPSIPETSTINHVFHNKSDVWFYSPKLQFNILLKFPIILLNYTLDYIPVYKYNYKQNISIMPLVSSGEAENKYSDTAGPYTKNNISLLVFNLFEFQLIYENQKLDYKQIGLAYNGGWHFSVQEMNKYTITTTTFIVNLRPDLFADVDLILGAGKRFLKTKNDTNGESLQNESEWIYNLGFAKRT